MPRMPWLGTRSPSRASAGDPLRIRWIGRGGSIGVVGVLGHARFERGDARPLLLDDREQMDDPLAHDERGLLPTGGIKRYPYWQ
jgi:hypothetical protein